MGPGMAVMDPPARICQWIRIVLISWWRRNRGAGSARAVGTHANDDVDASNPRAVGRCRQLGDSHALAGDILQPTRLLVEEVMVIARVRVEVGAARVHDDLAQQTGADELMEGVVDRSERHANRGCQCLAVQLLRSDVAIAFVEEHASKRETLA